MSKVSQGSRIPNWGEELKPHLPAEAKAEDFEELLQPGHDGDQDLQKLQSPPNVSDRLSTSAGLLTTNQIYVCIYYYIYMMHYI